MPRDFQGEMRRDIRHSTQVWPTFLADKTPERAPTVEKLMAAALARH